MDKYNVTGMSCSACSSRVEKAVSKVDGVTVCQVNLLTNSMMVDGTASSQAIIDAVQAAGYGASPVSSGTGSFGANTAKIAGEDETDRAFANMKKRKIGRAHV